MAKINLKIDPPKRSAQGPHPAGRRTGPRLPAAADRPIRTPEFLRSQRFLNLPNHIGDQFRAPDMLNRRVRALSLSEEGFRTLEKLVKERLPREQHAVFERAFANVHAHLPLGTRGRGLPSQELRQHAEDFAALFSTYHPSFAEMSAEDFLVPPSGFIFFNDLSGFPQVLLLRNFVIEAILLVLKLEAEWQEKRSKEEAKRQEKENEEIRLLNRRSEQKREVERAIERKRATAA